MCFQSRFKKVSNEGADLTWYGRACQSLGTATEKARNFDL